MRGILSHGVYLPYRRLDRSEIAAVAGTGGGKGCRTVAGFDEDTTTMAVEAGRLVLKAVATRPDALVLSTVTPAYSDKTNATAVHAALRLSPAVPAVDFGGAMRSTVGAVRMALTAEGSTLVVGSDIRTGLPGSSDESSGGDGAAALLIGDDASGETPVLAELIGSGAATEEFLDRWRTPGDVRSKVWEERFGELRYVPLGQAAWDDALKDSGLTADQVDRVAIASTHGRAVRGLVKKLALSPDALIDDLGSTVGVTGATQPTLLLSALLERATPGQVLALVVLADGADVLLFRATEAIAAFDPSRRLSAQADPAAGAPISYGAFLRWRGMLTAEPPRRPEPARVSSSAAARNEEWKFGFVGSRNDDGSVQLPPLPGGGEPVPMADAIGTIVTSTIDRLAWSPSPPVVFAVVDFDGGGRLPVELTDVDPDDVVIGGRVEMTFRRLSSADGIHNYFWKARPVRVDQGK